MSKKEKRKIALIRGILMLSACITAVSAYQLWQGMRIYAEGDQNYEQLQKQIRFTGPAQTEGGQAHIQPTAATWTDIPFTEWKQGTDVPATTATPAPIRLIELPPLLIDFQALRRINADAAAWLYCPDNVIDYPVMRANDYSYYLNHLPDGTKNANGSLFLDYNCPSDFSGRLSIIYGHAMKSGKMFGSLGDYKKQSYYDQYPYLYLYTPQGNYRVDLVYGTVIGAGEWRDRAFMFEVNLDSLLQYASAHTTFKSPVLYSGSDRFIALSTCSYEFDEARYVVIGVLRPEYGVRPRK